MWLTCRYTLTAPIVGQTISWWSSLVESLEPRRSTFKSAMSTWNSSIVIFTHSSKPHAHNERVDLHFSPRAAIITVDFEVNMSICSWVNEVCILASFFSTFQIAYISISDHRHRMFNDQYLLTEFCGNLICCFEDIYNRGRQLQMMLTCSYLVKLLIPVIVFTLSFLLLNLVITTSDPKDIYIWTTQMWLWDAWKVICTTLSL